MNCSNFNDGDLHTFDKINPGAFKPSPGDIPMLTEAPSFSLSKLAKLRESLFTNILMHMDTFDQLITPATCYKLSTCACHTFRYPIFKARTIYESIYKSFLMQKVTKKLLYQITVHLSGNVDYVRRDQVIPTWQDSLVPVWAPVEVVGLSEFYGIYKGKEVRVFITAGIPAGLTIEQRMSNKFIKHMLRETGYPRYKPFDVHEAYNIRFTCNFIKQRGSTKMAAFSVSSSQERHNKALYRVRHGECPMKYNIECPQCLKGLSECQGALHKETYVIGECVSGHRGVMTPGQDKCNECLEQDKYIQAKIMFERKNNNNGKEKEKEVGK